LFSFLFFVVLAYSCAFRLPRLVLVVLERPKVILRKSCIWLNRLMPAPAMLFARSGNDRSQRERDGAVNDD
jgi:hypothetical protein